MKISNEALKKHYYGAYSFKEDEDGYLAAFQYSDKQMEYFKQASDFWYGRCSASTAKTLEFITEATRFSFDYKIKWIGTKDSFELAVDGLLSRIWYVKDMDQEGTLSIPLPEGKKSVTVYLPCDATALIRNFEIDAAMAPVPKNEKVLWLGDSITQGYGPLRSACTYVSVANRILNYDLINQGIGGYVYDKNSLMEMPGYRPDKIIVALGTNQFETESMAAVEEYYERLIEVYGKTIPVLCITPLWRCDLGEREKTMRRFCESIRAICARYPNIKVIDGFRLIPHLREYFLDRVHPNVLGAQVCGDALADEIQKIGF